jgi:hypothetical protein
MKHLSIVIIAILILPNMIFALSFEGRITRKDTNEPATQALIVFSSNGIEKARTVTGDDGLYFIPNIPEGTYVVKISYRGVNREYLNVVVGLSARMHDFEI